MVLAATAFVVSVLKNVLSSSCSSIVVVLVVVLLVAFQVCMVPLVVEVKSTQ